MANYKIYVPNQHQSWSILQTEVSASRICFISGRKKMFSTSTRQRVIGSEWRSADWITWYCCFKERLKNKKKETRFRIVRIYQRRLPLSTIDIGSHGDAPLLLYLLPTFTLNHFQPLCTVQRLVFTMHIYRETICSRKRRIRLTITVKLKLKFITARIGNVRKKI